MFSPRNPSRLNSSFNFIPNCRDLVPDWAGRWRIAEARWASSSATTAPCANADADA